MATNVTQDHIEFMEQQLKNCQIHLEKAIQRMENYNNVKLPAKQNNPRLKAKKKAEWMAKQPIDIESKPEVINLRRKISHYEYAIEAIKEKQKREEKTRFSFKKRDSNKER